MLRSLSEQMAEAWRSRALLGLMAGREIRSRVSGTVLGLVWLYLQPLLTIAAYYLVFDVILNARLADGAPTKRVGEYLIVGMVPWMVFTDTVSRAMNSLVDAGGLLQKNALSPVLFPVRAVVASAITFLPPLLLVAAAFALMRGPTLALLLLPPLVVVQIALTFAIGYLLAILAAAVRDVLQIVGFCLTLGVFLSPVLFTPAMLPEQIRWLIWMNPMTPIILGFQSILLSGRAPGMQEWGAILVWLCGTTLILDRLIERSREHLVDWL